MDIKTLLAARRKAQLTQQQVADRLKITRASISQWEKGLTGPSAEHALALSRIYNIPAEAILGARKRADETPAQPPDPEQAELLAIWALLDKHSRGTILAEARKLKEAMPKDIAATIADKLRALPMGELASILAAIEAAHKHD